MKETVTTDSPERGSARVFALAPDDKDGIARALGMARESYEIKWWWKYGQPRIDLIKAKLAIGERELGSAVSTLMRLNSNHLQVTAECFPLGFPHPEQFLVNVEMRPGS